MSCQWLLAWNWIPRWARGSLLNANEVFNITQYWADFVTRENTEWEVGIKNCWQSWGKQQPEGGSCRNPGKTGWENKQELWWHRAFYNHDTHRAHGIPQDTADPQCPLGSKNSSRGDPWASHSSLPGFLCIQDIFLLSWEDLSCSKEYLVFTHSFTPTPRNILPRIFFFGVF